VSLTGTAFLVLVTATTVAAIAALVVGWPALAGARAARILTRAGLLLGVNALVLLTAAVQLNAQFLFFADWSDLMSAVGHGPAGTSVHRGGGAAAAAAQTVSGSSAVGASTLPPLPRTGVSRSGVITYQVHGAQSGLTGAIMVQLPPGYSDSANAAVRYPVLETFHGYPSGPGQWIGTMDIGARLAAAVAAGQMRPVLVVSPQLEFPLGVDTECVNGGQGLAQVETWLAVDVPSWVTHTFRVATARQSWATIGLSVGGWCAAMATMLHPAQYAAAIVLGGYFRPDFGPVYDPYPSGSALAARYDLVALIRRSPPPVAIWVETSHADALSYGSTAAALKAARPPLAVTADVLRNAGHRIGLWQGLMPTVLRWLGATVPGFAPTGGGPPGPP
jgi:hypothetical protein